MAAHRSEDAPTLSVCMIVKNEELNLARTLASVADLHAEVVVVDTGSTDRTVEIAKEHGARVEFFQWIDDFSAARNYAFAQARGKWMLVLDADEVVTPEFHEGIGAALAKSSAAGIRIPVQCVDDSGRLQQRVSSVRLVRSGFGVGYENRIHEDVEGPIARAGGKLEDLELPIVHYGYTASESNRKGRHERNLRMTMAAQEAAPFEPRYWHYLGLEYAVAGDYMKAAAWFERVLAEAPSSPLAGWSASQLASIRTSERALGAAWNAAYVGASAKLGRVPSLFKLGEIALRDGDPKAALECVSAIEKLPSRVEGDVARRDQAAVVLKAKAMVEQGAARQAYGLLVRGVRQWPSDGAIADALVNVAEVLHAGPRGWAAATKDTEGAPSVVAATMGGLVRHRAWSSAVEIGDRHGVRNEHYGYALLRVGRTDEAHQVFRSFGEDGAVHLLFDALDRRDASLIEETLAILPRSAHAVAECVASARAVSHDLAWQVMDWMRLAMAYRSDAVVSLLVRSLPGSPAERSALHAVHLFEAGEPMAALSLALECPDEPDAAEVIGLVAHQRRDFDAAATFLVARIRAGDPSVRVVTCCSDALKRVGRADLAKEVVALGRRSRPLARAFGS